MASMDCPKKNTAFTFGIALQSVATGTIFKTTPTLAAGDITVSIDGGNFANITTLPTQIQSTGVLPIALTAAEMNGDIIYVLFHDAAGGEWGDQLATLNTANGTLSEVNTDVEAILADTGTDGVVLAGTLATLDALWAKIQKWLRLGFRKDVAVATDYAVELGEINANGGSGAGAFANTTDSQESLRDNLAEPGDAMTFTMTPATIAAMISGTTMTIDTHNYFSIGLTVGNIATRTKAWIAIKSNKLDADSASILFCEETAGCTVVNGAVYATITDASLTVTNETTGATTFAIKAAVTAVLTPGLQHFWEYKVLEPSGPRTVAEGICLVEAGVIKAIA